MKCKCKFKTEMDYNPELQAYVCPDCGYEYYPEEHNADNIDWIDD